MIIKKRNPSDMTPQDRLREIAALLARGYLRLISSQKGLDLHAESKALYGKPVDSQAKEVA